MLSFFNRPASFTLLKSALPAATHSSYLLTQPQQSLMTGGLSYRSYSL